MELNDAQVLANRHEALVEEMAWLSRCRKGDEAAMNCIVAKHRRRLNRVAANVLRDPHEAEDVTQEAFLKAFRELHKLRDDRAFAGYLYRICVRLCMDRLRSRRPEPGIVDQAESSAGNQIENRILIERLLDQLNPDLRMTLVLREMEQLSYDEVADVMRVPVGTVRSRLHTARERFRAIWVAATGETN